MSEKMKLTKENIEKLKGKSALTDYVLDYVLEQWDDYDNKTDIFMDVLEHGCQSGIVSSLIYYDDTTKFYDNYKAEINALLYEVMQETGIYNPLELFGDKWDREDPLALDVLNKNLLAWFGFEETLRAISSKFEGLI
jgi:hypothetical protein